jgi:hypothetical protein
LQHGEEEALLLRECHFGSSKKMAERTGLEPATLGVTGRYSNQLNYRSALENFYVAAAAKGVVGAEGIEPPTFAL